MCRRVLNCPPVATATSRSPARHEAIGRKSVTAAALKAAGEFFVRAAATRKILASVDGSLGSDGGVANSGPPHARAGFDRSRDTYHEKPRPGSSRQAVPTVPSLILNIDG
jgi:hypothetical protein